MIIDVTPPKESFPNPIYYWAFPFSVLTTGQAILQPQFNLNLRGVMANSETPVNDWHGIATIWRNRLRCALLS